LVQSIIQANYLHYFGLIPAADMVIQDYGALADIAGFAYGSARPRTPLLVSDVAAHLDRRGVIDMSRAHLDEHRVSLQRVAHLAAATAILGELLYLPIIVPETGARIASDIAREYEHVLKTDDFDGKAAAAHAVAAILREHERRMRNRLARRLVNGIAGGVEAVAQDLPLMHDLFLPTYRLLGYQLPGLRPSGSAIRMTGNAARITQQDEQAAKDLPDERTVRPRAADLNAQWRLTSRERRVPE
jgi:hypothetical protein